MFTKHWHNSKYMASGFYLALGMVFITYSSFPDRTPVLAQAILFSVLNNTPLHDLLFLVVSPPAVLFKQVLGCQSGSMVLCHASLSH
jgi:hypothetical protein